MKKTIFSLAVLTAILTSASAFADIDQAQQSVFSIGVDELHTSVSGQSFYGNRFSASVMSTQPHHALTDWTIGAAMTIALYNSSALTSWTTLDGVASTEIGNGWSANMRAGVGIINGAIGGYDVGVSHYGYDAGIGLDYKITKSFTGKIEIEQTNAYVAGPSLDRKNATIASVGLAYTF